MIGSTAHPSEILLFFTSATGFIITLMAWRIFRRAASEVRRREINGLKRVLASAHERDERIRLMILGLMMVAAVLFMLAPSVDPMPRELVMARAILNAVAILTTLKSYFNMRDRDHIADIQSHRKQRADDLHTGRAQQ